MLVYDGAGIVEGTEIDPKALVALAKELCSDGSWHRELSVDKATRKMQEDQFDDEVKRNGYCNACASHAGFILSKFNITERH